MRPGLQELTAGQEELAELEILLSGRRDLVTEQSRSVTRLRETLLSTFPALERALDPNRRGALTFISHYQRPAQIRRAGRKRLAAYLRNRGVQGAEDTADKALWRRPRPRALPCPPKSSPLASIVAELAEEILSLKDRIESIDEELEQRFFARPEARVLASLPGMGPILGAEFLVAVGVLSAFATSADQLAAYAGLLVPAAHDDSGKRVGNHRRRMRGGNPRS